MVSFVAANLVATATVSGGSWIESGDLSLQNVKTDRLQLPARSTDLAAASTVLLVDHAVTEAFDTGALVGHNLSLSATFRKRWSDDALLLTDPDSAGGVGDTGVQDVWSAVRSIEVSDFFDWDPVYGRPESIGTLPPHLIVRHARAHARYERWDIVDTTNAAGAVDIGTLWSGLTFSTAWPFDWPVSFGPVSQSEVQVGDAVDFFDRKGATNEWRMPFEELSKAERDLIMLLARQRDVVEPFLVLADSSAEAEFFGDGPYRLKTLPTSSPSRPAEHALTLELVQWR